MINFFLNDPMYEIDSITTGKILKKLYPISNDLFEEIETKNYSEEELFENKIKENYFNARLKAICEFSEINLYDYVKVNKSDLEINYPELFQRLQNKEK